MSAVTAPATTLDVLDPATGEVVGTIPAGDERAADDAVRAAAAAAPGWARTAAGERAAVLKDAARRLRAGDALEELAVLQTRENGRPLAESRAGAEAAVGALEQYAELGPVHRGRTLQGAWGATDLMVHEPRGVVALLVPWNDPIAIAVRPARGLPGGGQRGRAQAVGEDAARHDPPARAARPPGRGRAAAPGRRACRAAAGRAPSRRPGRAHRLGHDRPRARGGLRRRPAQGAARAGRQGPADRRRGRRPGVGGGPGRRGRVRQRRPALHVGRADLRAPGRRRGVHRRRSWPRPGPCAPAPGSTPRPPSGR